MPCHMYAERCATSCNVPVDVMPTLSLHNAGHASGWEEYVTKRGQQKNKKGREGVSTGLLRWDWSIITLITLQDTLVAAVILWIHTQYKRLRAHSQVSFRNHSLVFLRDLQQTVAEEKLWVFCHKSKLFTLIKHTPSQAFFRKSHLSYMCKID